MERFKSELGVIGIAMLALLLALGIIFMTGCGGRRELCYCIHGVTPGGHEAMWYTNNYEVSGDTVYYFNSDGSRVDIMAPCTIVDNCKD